MNMPRSFLFGAAWLFAAALLLTATVPPDAEANYTFLGKVDSTENTPSGLTLYCEGNNQVQITFLQPNLFRYTMLRADYAEPLLQEPLTLTAWESVPVECAQNDTLVRLKSSELELEIQKFPCRLTVRNKQGEVISKDDPGMGVGWDGKEVRCWRTITADERFLGLGEKVLAAPVTREGQYVKKVYLPKGRWLDANTEELYEGKQAVYVDALLDRLPLFLREGAIIPSREPVQFVDEKPLTKLILDVFPSAQLDTFRYYEDDGKSLDYRQGNYRITEFICAQQNGELHFEKRRVHDRYEAPERELEIRFHAVSKALRDIMLDYQPLQDYDYDDQKRILIVTIPDEGNVQNLTIR